MKAADDARKLLVRLRDRGSIGNAPEIRALFQALNAVNREYYN